MMNPKSVRRIQALHVVKAVGQLQATEASANNAFTKIGVRVQQQEFKLTVRTIIQIRQVGIQSPEGKPRLHDPIQAQHSFPSVILLLRQTQGSGSVCIQALETQPLHCSLANGDASSLAQSTQGQSSKHQKIFLMIFSGLLSNTANYTKVFKCQFIVIILSL